MCEVIVLHVVETRNTQSQWGIISGREREREARERERERERERRNKVKIGLARGCAISLHVPLGHNHLTNWLTHELGLSKISWVCEEMTMSWVKIEIRWMQKPLDHIKQYFEDRKFISSPRVTDRVILCHQLSAKQSEVDLNKDVSVRSKLIQFQIWRFSKMISWESNTH